MKCATSVILPVSRREQNEVDDFYKSTSQQKSNHDSPTSYVVEAPDDYSDAGFLWSWKTWVLIRGASIRIFEADPRSQKAVSADPITDTYLFKAFFLSH